MIRRLWTTRHLRLSINRRGQVVLTMPVLCSQKVALAFLKENQDWIETQRQKYANRLTFFDGQQISLLGQELTIRHDSDRIGTEQIGNILYVSGDKDFLNRRVTDYVKRRTQSYIEAKAHQLAAQIGTSVRRISLKDTTSRWGSCSVQGNLNFCWRLGMAPLFVLDYIIAHEVAHRIEMNHSHHFWRVVAQLCENRSEAEIWLRRHGSTLR